MPLQIEWGNRFGLALTAYCRVRGPADDFQGHTLKHFKFPKAQNRTWEEAISSVLRTTP